MDRHPCECRIHAGTCENAPWTASMPGGGDITVIPPHCLRCMQECYSPKSDGQHEKHDGHEKRQAGKHR